VEALKYSVWLGNKIFLEQVSISHVLLGKAKRVTEAWTKEAYDEDSLMINML
jgi:hypothetical protein